MMHILLISWSLNSGVAHTIVSYPTAASCESARVKVSRPDQRAECFSLPAPPDPAAQLRRKVTT